LYKIRRQLELEHVLKVVDFDLAILGKAIPIQAWTVPQGSRRLRLAGFLDNGHMKAVRLSALRTGRVYPIPGTHFC